MHIVIGIHLDLKVSSPNALLYRLVYAFKRDNQHTRVVGKYSQKQLFTENLLYTLKDNKCFMKWLRIENKYAKYKMILILLKYTVIFTLQEVDLWSTILYTHNVRWRQTSERQTSCSYLKWIRFSSTQFSCLLPHL